MQLWRRPVATAPIQLLAWEPPYAVGAVQKMAKRQKKKNQKKNLLKTSMCAGLGALGGTKFSTFLSKYQKARLMNHVVRAQFIL